MSIIDVKVAVNVDAEHAYCKLMLGSLLKSLLMLTVKSLLPLVLAFWLKADSEETDRRFLGLISDIPLDTVCMSSTGVCGLGAQRSSPAAAGEEATRGRLMVFTSSLSG